MRSCSYIVPSATSYCVKMVHCGLITCDRVCANTYLILATVAKNLDTVKFAGRFHFIIVLPAKCVFCFYFIFLLYKFIIITV